MSFPGTKDIVRRLPALLASLTAFVILFLCYSPRPARAQSAANYTGISVQASPQIFATLCALEAAGFDPGQTVLTDSTAARADLRTQLLALNGPAAQALRQFYRDHALGDPTETLSRYVTFAVVAGPPPQFQLSEDRDSLPPDVLSIEGFDPILSAFYREARLDARRSEMESEYSAPIGSYNSELGRIVTTVNAYLREVIRPSSGRQFVVDVEPIVGEHTNFRNFGDTYTIVVGPDSDASRDLIRHAYLHFVIDPLVLRNRAALDKHRAVLDIAARDPLTPEEYQDDVVGLLDESVIKAVELRLNHLHGDALESALKDMDVNGFVAVRPLVAELLKFEKAEPAMSYYFGDIITGLDADADRAQLQKLVAQTNPAPQTAPKVQADPIPVLEQWLAEGERDIAQKDGGAGIIAFKKALARAPDDPRALYGLAIAYVLSGRAGDAQDLFEAVISGASSPSGAQAKQVDPTILAWSHVYLGRMHDLASERDLALGEYKAALAVEGAEAATRSAAEQGIASPYAPPGMQDPDSRQ